MNFLIFFSRLLAFSCVFLIKISYVSASAAPPPPPPPGGAPSFTMPTQDVKAQIAANRQRRGADPARGAERSAAAAARPEDAAQRDFIHTLQQRLRRRGQVEDPEAEARAERFARKEEPPLAPEPKPSQQQHKIPSFTSGGNPPPPPGPAPNFRRASPPPIIRPAGGAERAPAAEPRHVYKVDLEEITKRRASLRRARKEKPPLLPKPKMK